jgi:hypothetical protein
MEAEMAGYVSALEAGEFVIDDSTPLSTIGQICNDPVINGEQVSRGRLPRDYNQEPFGSLPFAAPFPSDMLIPESEWDDRIKEMEATKTRLTDLCDQAGLTVLDQNGTNYCWINAPVHCVEVLRVANGQPLVRLSPASCGGPIKNYRNVGGWGTEGLKYIVSTGIVPQAQWPPNAITKSYDTAETRELRKQFKVTEWWDLRPRNMQELISCLLQRIPVAVGLNWWSHEVTYMDPVALGGGKYGARIDNSWSTSWGTNGRGILSGSKVLPDDAVAPRVATPS